MKINWSFGKIIFSKRFKKPSLIRYGKRHYLQHKNQALELVTARVLFFNSIYQTNFNKIKIRSQKTRWGSCSTMGNLSFNYKILFLSEKARDYIIVHELCHLREFNHSKNFWTLVEKVFPNHLEIKKEIRKNILG